MGGMDALGADIFCCYFHAAQLNLTVGRRQLLILL